MAVKSVEESSAVARRERVCYGSVVLFFSRRIGLLVVVRLTDSSAVIRILDLVDRGQSRSLRQYCRAKSCRNRDQDVKRLSAKLDGMRRPTPRGMSKTPK